MIYKSTYKLIVGVILQYAVDGGHNTSIENGDGD